MAKIPYYAMHGPETKILKAAQCPRTPQKRKNLADNETNASLEVASNGFGNILLNDILVESPD